VRSPETANGNPEYEITYRIVWTGRWSIIGGCYGGVQKVTFKDHSDILQAWDYDFVRKLISNKIWRRSERYTFYWEIDKHHVFDDQESISGIIQESEDKDDRSEGVSEPTQVSEQEQPEERRGRKRRRGAHGYL
jgi:hypothetical protein